MTAMLLRFSVTNHMSVRDRAELSFVATSLKDLPDSVLVSRYARHGVLPVVAVYGANASGKSNLLFALRTLRSLVVNSFVRSEEVDGGSLPYNPFRLDDESQSQPTEFELDFVLNETRYQFGVEYDGASIKREWLYAFPKSHQQTLYFRDTELPGEMYFGRNLTGALRQIESITKKDSLFISSAKKSGHPLLSEISDFFRFQIRAISIQGALPGEAIAEAMSDRPEILDAIKNYIRIADTGIEDLRVESIPVSESEKLQLSEIIQFVKKITKVEDAAVAAPEVKNILKLGHRCGDGSIRYLDIQDESLGTRYLMALLPPMIQALDQGGALVLDEITTSLHTLLGKHLVQLFNDKASNPKGAQLIFTTHDTNLLSPEVIRRDGILITNKNRDGSSNFEPLSDTKTKNTDNLERGYLQGRYGGIPFIVG